MFLRKLTVLLVPLGMLLVLCLLVPLFGSMDKFFGPLLLGAFTGGFTAAAAGVCAAVVFGFFTALLFRSKDKG